MSLASVIKNKFTQIIIKTDEGEITKPTDSVEYSCAYHKVSRKESAKKLLARNTCCSKCANLLNKGHALNLDGKPYNSKKILEIDSLFQGRFDYTNFRSVDTFTPSTIICQDHGPFESSLIEHVLMKNQAGCPSCAIGLPVKEEPSIKISNEKSGLLKELKVADTNALETHAVIENNDDWMENAKSLFISSAT